MCCDITLYITQLVGVLGATEFLPARQSSSDAFGQLCAAVPSACVDILDAICGADDENFNLTRLPEYFVNTPAGERLGLRWVLRSTAFCYTASAVAPRL